MGGGRSLSVARGRVQKGAGDPIGARSPRDVIPRAAIRSVVMESLPTDILCLHLAGGTADEAKRLTATFGAPGRWRDRSPDEWIRAGLPEPVVDRARTDWDGRSALAERQECEARGVRL